MGVNQEWQGQWEPAIPEPYWFRKWFRWVPGCFYCSLYEKQKVTFRDHEEWGAHWLRYHRD